MTRPVTPRDRHHALPSNLPPRGLSREAAAAYVGVSATTFDKMVISKEMPSPRRSPTSARKVWDLRELDKAFDRLPHAGGDRDDDDADTGDVWSSPRV